MSHDHDHHHHGHDHAKHDHAHDHESHDPAGHGHAAHGHGGHAHGHGHHGHSHGPPPDDWRYGVGVGLNLAFVLAEVVAGALANSTALFADAGHNLSDVLGLALAGGAAWLAKRPGGAKRTYGFGKATVFAALINGLILVFASGVIVWEAGYRILHPEPVKGGVVMITAALGVLINGGTALMFMRGREKDANVRGAFLHMASDAVISAGVVVSGLIVALTGFEWLDPLVSLVIVVVVLMGTFGLLRDATDMAMDAAPPGVDPQAVKAFLATQPGVTEVHDLHIWSMGASEAALTAHLVRPEAGDDDAFLQGLCGQIDKQFGVGHATIQIERRSFDCHPKHG